MHLTRLPDVPFIRAEWPTRIEPVGLVSDAVLATVGGLERLHPLLAEPYHLGGEESWSAQDVLAVLERESRDPERFEGDADFSFFAPRGGWGTAPMPRLDLNLSNWSARPGPRTNLAMLTWDRAGGSPQQRVEAMGEVGLGVLDLLIDTWRPSTAAILSAAAQRAQRQGTRTSNAAVGPVTWFSDRFAIPPSVPGAKVAPHRDGTLLIVGTGLPDADGDTAALVAAAKPAWTSTKCSVSAVWPRAG